MESALSSSSKQPPSSSIHIRGARVNNLKDVSLDIGVSGSGKSSIVFHTLAAESQRLLHETLPTFVQGFLPRFGRLDVNVLENLSAASSVSSTPNSHTSWWRCCRRSTTSASAIGASGGRWPPSLV